MTIADNEVGFDAQSSLDIYPSGNHLGILNMLKLTLHGTLTIDSKGRRISPENRYIILTPYSSEE